MWSFETEKKNHSLHLIAKFKWKRMTKLQPTNKHQSEFSKKKKRKITQHLIANNENVRRCYPTWRMSRLTTQTRTACSCVLKDLQHSPIWNPLWTWDTKPECCSKSCTPLATPCPPSIHRYWPVQKIQISVCLIWLCYKRLGQSFSCLTVEKVEKKYGDLSEEKLLQRKPSKVCFFFLSNETTQLKCVFLKLLLH